jgi:transposase-like protein
MPAERVSMRHAREIIRLKFSAYVSAREIARRLGIARSTVRETLRRFESAGLIWPLPDHMSDGALEASLYARRPPRADDLRNACRGPNGCAHFTSSGLRALGKRPGEASMNDYAHSVN